MDLGEKRTALLERLREFEPRDRALVIGAFQEADREWQLSRLVTRTLWFCFGLAVGVVSTLVGVVSTLAVLK